MCLAQRAQIRACHITGASRGWRLNSLQEIDYFTFFLIYLAFAECKYLRRHANLTYLDLPVWILRFVLGSSRGPRVVLIESDILKL